MPAIAPSFSCTPSIVIAWFAPYAAPAGTPAVRTASVRVPAGRAVVPYITSVAVPGVVTLSVADQSAGIDASTAADDRVSRAGS